MLPFDGDVVGDGGLGDVSSYLVEWSKQPFTLFAPTVQVAVLALSASLGLVRCVTYPIVTSFYTEPNQAKPTP